MEIIVPLRLLLLLLLVLESSPYDEVPIGAKTVDTRMMDRPKTIESFMCLGS